MSYAVCLYIAAETQIPDAEASKKERGINRTEARISAAVCTTTAEHTRTHSKDVLETQRGDLKRRKRWR